MAIRGGTVARLRALRADRAHQSGRGSDENSRAARASARIERFRVLLDRHCRERKSVESYARAMGVTPGQLTRLCRDTLGVCALAAIDARAIHEAKRELAYSTLSVKQIAAELGFRRRSLFRSVFQEADRASADGVPRSVACSAGACREHRLARGPSRLRKNVRLFALIIQSRPSASSQTSMYLAIDVKSLLRAIMVGGGASHGTFRI